MRLSRSFLLLQQGSCPIERAEAHPLARESVRPALLAVDNAYRRTHDETGLTGSADRLEEGATGRDDVLDEAHGLARLERPLDAVGRPVLLRRVTDHEERKAGNERCGGREHDT